MTVLTPTPRVLMSAADWQQLMAFVGVCEVEINGFAYVDQIAPNTFLVTEPFILPQVATAGSVDTDEQAIHGHIYEMMQRGDSASRMCFQWHSHVKMQAYFSPTDTANIDRWSGKMLISLVANQFGNYSLRVDTYDPVRVGVEAKLEVMLPSVNAATVEATRQLVAETVRRPAIIRGLRGRPAPVGDHVLASAGFSDADELLFEIPVSSNGNGHGPD